MRLCTLFTSIPLAGFIVISQVQANPSQDSTQWVMESQPDQLTFPSKDATENELMSPQPFYIISHRTLTVGGVVAAVNDGANAMEIDARAYAGGWRADHDGIPFLSSGDSMRKMFEAIAAERRAGKVITFVWLDIKNADECPPIERSCSVLGLQDLARELLEPVGVRVLYGISKSSSAPIKLLGQSLNSNEALGIDCEAGDDVLSLFRMVEPPLTKNKTVYSCGLFSFDLDIRGERKRKLLEGIRSQAYGRTLGWTLLPRDIAIIQELGGAGVDGMIYAGTPANAYGVSSTIGDILGGLFGKGGTQRENERRTQKMVAEWVRGNPEKRYIARQEDAPW
ncbi:hypothetical protein ONZ43_g3681 [Nemania bipapillata]|uniref:Uncharacterized protein n=1 Tax=Nemania bipapillata TaxID=110536 RepID=A0ACC2IW07_9PEZI|nr:hypothetical protein ONZ43_g3681 [Nemania bipapillata]